MNALAVTGYAGVDYVVGLVGQIAGDHTTLIDYRDPDDWPRVGGCPAYVAMAVAQHGHRAYPVSWTGSDDHGDFYLAGLTAVGVDTKAVSRLDRKSPMSILGYQADGTCACLFDPGFGGEEVLTDTQRALISAASHVCVTVGPPQVTADILSARNEKARLYWICKNDLHCFTPPIRERLSAEADVIFLSSSERGLVGNTRDTAVIVETLGSEGVRVAAADSAGQLPVERIAVRDTTGAGDTFAGGFIAAEMAGTASPLDAARAGIASVSAMLTKRSARGET